MNWYFHPDARAEFHDAAMWYEDRRPGLGDEFIREIDGAIGRISNHPDGWRRIQGEARWCRVQRFPYAVIYRCREEVETLAMMHLRRQPGYWLKRLEG